jgi:hypothetical protein
MPRRVRSLLCRGAATALIACAGPALPGPQPVTSLPQWMVRAQERLGLEPAQQRELRMLVDANADRLHELRERYADDTSPQARKLQLQELAGLQLEFRHRLAAILTTAQLAEWDTLIEELLGRVHLLNPPRLVDGAR